MATLYRVIDEPRPGRLARLSVDPMWPLFGLLFTGPWFAWPWFVLNGFAVGSPTRGREAAVAIGGFVGLVLLGVSILILVHKGLIDRSGIRYAVVGITFWKVAISYVLFFLQRRSFEIYEYYGGTLNNGLIAVILAALSHRYIVDRLPFDLGRLILG